MTHRFVTGCVPIRWIVLLVLGLMPAVGGVRGPAAVQAQVSFTQTGFFTETIATLSAFTPVGVAFAPDGRLFVWQKAGQVRIIKNGQLLTTPFLDISAHVNQYLDHGLLGLALDPNFAANGYVYLAYVYEGGGNPNDQGPKISRLSRVQADPNSPDIALAGETIIIDNIPSEAQTHSIGSLRFAADGKLFVTIGDAATDVTVDPLALRAQDFNSLNGKILRINPDGSAPADNPFYEPATPASVRSKVWAYGLHNPFRLALHPTSGVPYIGDMGWHTWEELDRGRGVNFGWPCFEGPDARLEYQVFAECQGLAQPAMTAGTYVYDHTVGNSIIAGSFYTGAQYPVQYQGNFFVADYGGGWIKRLVFDANDNLVGVNPFASNLAGPVALEMGPEGFLYYVALGSGEIGRIRFSGAANTPPVAKATVTPSAGYSPLTVTFSSAGSVDPEGGALTYSWDFGDGTSTTAANPTHQYVTPGVTTFTPTLTATDPGSLSTSATTKVTVGSLPPVATLTTTPAAGTTVQPGDTITYQGSAFDPEEGQLSGAALSWQVLLHHDSHVHPVMTGTGATGNFVVPDHGVGTYACEIVLTATDSSGLSDTKSVTLPAASTDSSLTHLDFTYPNRTALTLAGWDFLAKTAVGTTRNTEQTGGLTVDYNQTSHPGVLRIPMGTGTLRRNANNSRNTLFRNLPSDWTSLRLKVATFDPSANYQHVGLLAYQDDDNYVSVNRPYLNGPQIEAFREAGQETTLANGVGLVNTDNLILRLDRDTTTNIYRGSYSTNNGTTWVEVGSTVAALTNPRLGIQAGFNLPGAPLAADLVWVEIRRPPAPVVSGVTPNTGVQGQTLGSVIITGSNFQSGATCSFGSGIIVNSCTFTSATQMSANLTIGAASTLGGRTVTVTNPSTRSGSLPNAFSILAPPPTVSGVTPSSGMQGQTLGSVGITGSNFQSGATCSFGSGITVNSCTFISASQLTASVTIAANATIGGRTVTVTNPDTQSGSLANAFAVRASAPVVSGVTPNTGVRGQTLTGVVITGSNFQSGATPSFGNGIMVNGWTFISSTQLKVDIGIDANATIGGYTVTVTNPDTQSGSLANAFTVTGISAPAPVVSSVNPNTGAQGQTLTSVGINGSNFQSGATCSFGTGITVNSCTFNSAAQLTANLTIAATATPGTRTVSVTNPDAQSGSLTNAFSVTSSVVPAPSLTTVNPNTGAQGQTLSSVTIAGNNFQSGATCSFGTGITVNSCTLNSATQLTANITIAANGSVGARTVSVTNPDAQSGSLANGFSVTAATVPAPIVNNVNPTTGAQGQTLSGVLINGNNFQSGATCSFGAGITVNSCTFTSTTQLTASITIAANATTGGYTVTVTNPDTQSGSLANAFTVTQVSGGTAGHFDFTAASSTALKAGGWDYLAKTAAGATRNTEQSGALAVDYNQTTHPGVLRFPISRGEIWQSSNDSQNMLLRNLPTDWTSLRLKISAFNPNADYQQVGLLAYQDDDTYVSVRRNYNSGSGGPNIGGMYEVSGVGTVVQRQALTNTGNLILRLDRNLSTNAYSPFYSVNNGATWVALTGIPAVTLSNARVAIQVGSNTAGTLPVADFAWVEILRPAPTVNGVNPSSGVQGQTLTSVVISGSNFQSGATCSFGTGITVISCTFNSATQLTANMTITGAASVGGHAVSVTNPDTQSGSLANAFTVTAASGPLPPSISTVSPSSGAQGQTLTRVVITGSDFQSGATCSFGAGITVTSCAFNSSTQLTANLTIDANATTGGYTATVTNPDAQSGSFANAFSVVTPSSTAPVVSLLSPNSGAEGQSLTVSITGSNFVSGATCSFGGGIVVSSCLFNSPTQLIVSIAIAANAITAPTETRTVTVTNPDAQSGAFQNGFTIVSGSTLAGHFDFTYSDRTSLLADGWSYIAKTASGGTRNTEQTGSLAVDYSQATHPGMIRIPLGGGEIWQASNNSQNMLLRNLPVDWTSIRLKIGAFNPTKDFQQVGLIAYQDDDIYVSVRRNYNSAAGGASVGAMYEVNSVGTVTERRGLANTGNLLLRIDRNPSTNAYTPFYSVNGGATWIGLVGVPSLVLNNPRLAIQVGANLAADTTSADLAWVEIIHPNSFPAPTVSGVTPTTCEQGQQCTVTVTGTNFQNGAACTFGSGITINSCTFNSAMQLVANIAVQSTATVGSRTVTVINPDTQAANLANGFGVTTATPVTPTVSSISPTTGSQGQNLLVTITGVNFQFGAGCDFGSGVLVQSCTFGSSTQMLANLTVTGATALGARTVTVTNPGIQGGSLANAFTVTAGNLPITNILTVAVLVNSSNSTGYNTAPGTPGEFQRYPQRYLDHLQVPYEVLDTATTQPPADLGMRQLIIAGHTGLNLSSAWRNAIVSAVNGGTGFVNLDAAPTIGAQSHIQSLFGATSSSAGTPATTLSVPAAVLPGGATPHFIAALQRKFLGDPAGDNVYAFHADATNVVQPVTATVLTPTVGTVIAKLGSDPLIVAQQTAGGRVVHFGSYLYLKADRFGFVQGLDDVFWRSLVWAARKPFVVRGYPRYWAVQMDDTMPGWETRVKDLYNPTFTGTKNASGVGGPWKVTGYLFTENFPAGSTARASMISDIQSGKLEVTPHSFTNITYGDMYWYSAVGQNSRALTDGEWIDNLTEIQAFKQGNGGSDTIPSFSRSLVAHFWDLSNNTGYDLWNTLGFRYVTSVLKPGFQRPANSQTVNVYNGAERLHAEDFWPYELPPKLDPSESTPFFFADDYPVGSRAGLPSQPFFLFATQYIDLAKYPRNDFIWPSSTYNLSPAQSTDYLQRYTWRHWSGMSPVQLFTHDIINYELATAPDRQTVIQQASTWLSANEARHVFMEDLGDYMYARTKSVLVNAVQTTGGVQVTLTGNTVTPDGAPVVTQFLVFYQDAEGAPVDVPGFTGGTTAAMALP